MPAKKTNRYRLLVENSSDLVAEVTLGGRFLYVSPNFQTLLGYEMEELVNTDVFALVHPDDLALARERYALPEATATIRYRHKNGSWRWLEAKGREFVTPGGETRAVIILRDVTERHTAEEALRQSEQRTRAILENALDAVVAISNEGGITEWNAQAERVFGWRRDEVIGRKMAEVLVPEAMRTKHEQGMHRCLTTGGEVRIMSQRREMVALHRDGSEIPVELSITPIQTSEGTSFCLFIRDLSGLKEARETKSRLESQLRQSQKMEAIGRLAGGIAHDFNNILAVIMANTELARMDLGDGHPIDDNLSEISRASRRAADLVRQILAFSRQKEQERRVLKLEPIIGEAAKMLRSTLPASIDIQMEIGPVCPSVLADPGQIHQVLLNLAMNAAHAMREMGGVMEISLQTMCVDEELAARHPDLRVGEYLRLAVSDSGHGMDAATVERIFEPFFTTKLSGEGTGLGLSVVHGIVKSHEGAVTVYSEPGRGTSFHIYLPAVDAAASNTEFCAAAIPRGKGQRILIVDDECAISEGVGRLLKRLGYESTASNDAAAALDLLRSTNEPFDCIITDLTMPGMSGIELARNCQELCPTTPVLLTSGYSGSLSSEFLRSHGIRELILKPYSPQIIAEALNRVLNGKNGKET